MYNNFFSNAFKFYHRSILYLFPILLFLGPALTNLGIILSCLLFFLNFHNLNNLNLFKDRKIISYLFICISYFILSSLLSSDIFLSLEGSLLYLRFIIFSLAISFYLLIEDDKYIKLFYFYILFLLSIIFIDSNIQYITGKNILLFEKPNLKRVSSFFGEESILGKYILSFLPIFLSAYLYIFKKKILSIFFLITFAVVYLTYLSGERSSFFLSIISFILLLFKLNKNFNINQKIILFISFLILFFLLYAFFPLSFERIIIDTYKDIFKEGNSYIISEQYQAHFLTALGMFKDKIIFGHGPELFRVICKDIAYNYLEGCSTSPHSFYLQLLSETGLIGFTLILLLFIVVFYKYLNSTDDLRSIYLVSVIIFLFPLTTNGNFFSTWINAPFYFSLGFLFYYFRDK